MSNERNDGLHPRHPGRGRAGVIECESADGEPEIGGCILFLPSGRSKVIQWRQPEQIQPTLGAAKDFCTKIVDSLLEESGGNPGHPDIRDVNWTSMAAAVQRIILDWNDKLSSAIRAKMLRDSIEGKMINVRSGADRRLTH